MTAPHSDIGPELRQLAQAILDRLDPAVRSAAAMAAESLRGPGRCQQVWCPVCALAALVTGEQHPMLTMVAEHSAALLTMVRSIVSDGQPSGGPAPAAPPDGGRNGSPAPGHGRYQHIPVTVEE